MAHVHTRGNDNFGKNKRFYMALMDVGGRLRTITWRREWDSNPRYGFPYTRFPSVRLQPLGHPSKENGGRTIAAEGSVTTRGRRRAPNVPGAEMPPPRALRQAL